MQTMLDARKLLMRTLLDDIDFSSKYQVAFSTSSIRRMMLVILWSNQQPLILTSKPSDPHLQPNPQCETHHSFAQLPPWRADLDLLDHMGRHVQCLCRATRDLKANVSRLWLEPLHLHNSAKTPTAALLRGHSAH